MAQLQRLAVAATQINPPQIALTAAQQHYLKRVLRLQAGDRFIALDGQGHWWLSILDASITTAEIVEALPVQTELPVSVTLLMALPKNGMDDVVRQATELGVDRIVPILSDRSLLKPSPQKCDRWQRIAQEAAEQSERQIIPAVLQPQSWTAALQTWNQDHAACFLCLARGERSHLLSALTHLKHHSPPIEPTAIVIAIGCEGGWTSTEVEAAIALGYQPVSLGDRILRAVTAPLVALSLIGSVWEGMSDSSVTL